MNDDFFEIFPRVVRSGVKSTVCVRERYNLYGFTELAKAGRLEALLIPNSGTVPAEYRQENNRSFQGALHTEGGRLLIELPPQTEGEITLELDRLNPDGKRDALLKTSLYALDEDLYRKRPYRGDLHVHCNYSHCGRKLDDLCYAAVMGRKNGLDFMALTDHEQMESSLKAREFIRKLPTDFLLLLGEECHLLEEPAETLFRYHTFVKQVHIVNFGGSQGVIRYANEHFDEYQRDVKRRAEQLDPVLPEDLRFYMAGADWIIDKIHEFGGLAVFCHPFWRPASRRNLPDPVREYILKQDKYDVMELIGLGGEGKPEFYEGNALCLAWWQEASIKAGRLIPAVGTTDSHNSDVLPGKQYTLVFCEKCEEEMLKDALRRGECTAVRHYDSDCTPFVAGNLRLSSYSYFLLREFFPLHDELCQLEGLAFRAALRGECANFPESPAGRDWEEKLFSRFFGEL